MPAFVASFEQNTPPVKPVLQPTLMRTFDVARWDVTCYTRYDTRIDDENSIACIGYYFEECLINRIEVGFHGESGTPSLVPLDCGTKN